MLILARHAEAGRKGGWGGPDLQRPLTPQGLDQADGLFARLVPAGLAVEEPLCWPKGSAWLLWRVQHRLHARFLAARSLDIPRGPGTSPA
jgi:phosphohistidine phosphatase SixA